VGFPSASGAQGLARGAAVLAGTLAMAPTQSWPGLPAVGAAYRWPNVPGRVAASDAWLQRILEKETTWHKLQVGESITVPASTNSLAAGVVRISWVGKSAEPRFRLAVNFQTSQEGRSGKVHFEIPLTLVPPVQPDAQVLRVREISARGQQEKVVFHCWSATRDSFPLTVAVDGKDNGCFECKWQPLTEQEKGDLAARLATHQPPLLSRVRCGYQVTVTVHERRSDDQLLDLGPFRRGVLLNWPDGSGAVPLEGAVKGEVTLHTPDGKDAINLERFRAPRGTTWEGFLTSERPDVQFKVDSKSPDYVVVTLAPENGVKQRWKLTVTVPPGRATGVLPEDSAVILQTQGEAGRRLRIPLTGESSQ
jgi:hypothetical protein